MMIYSVGSFFIYDPSEKESCPSERCRIFSNPLPRILASIFASTSDLRQSCLSSSTSLMPMVAGGLFLFFNSLSKC